MRLLYPLKYQHVYIPVMPCSLTDYLEVRVLVFVCVGLCWCVFWFVQAEGWAVGICGWKLGGWAHSM